ncbi:hypothetical protein BDQ12DRAFT_713203 [Crucibulum laeve]|uniref:Uncharacterized protein n=1 Tax=Crucibulum laeve TaxID=68775 RepID=A0A5C3LY13_9AGAR|nr:hypothetical protein BDQ12DRAFT_713203 [Crucibulum laeve]
MTSLLQDREAKIFEYIIASQHILPAVGGRSQTGTLPLLSDKDLFFPQLAMGLDVLGRLGAFSAPIVATTLIFIGSSITSSLATAAFNAIIMAMVFRFKPQDQCLMQFGQRVNERAMNERSIPSNSQPQGCSSPVLLFYVDVEVTIGGWIVVYVIEVRGGGRSSGYISSRFFGDLTVGHIILPLPGLAIQELGFLPL